MSPYHFNFMRRYPFCLTNDNNRHIKQLKFSVCQSIMKKIPLSLRPIAVNQGDEQKGKGDLEVFPEKNNFADQ